MSGLFDDYATDMAVAAAHDGMYTADRQILPGYDRIGGVLDDLSLSDVNTRADSMARSFLDRGVKQRVLDVLLERSTQLTVGEQEAEVPRIMAVMGAEPGDGEHSVRSMIHELARNMDCPSSISGSSSAPSGSATGPSSGWRPCAGRPG